LGICEVQHPRKAREICENPKHNFKSSITRYFAELGKRKSNPAEWLQAVTPSYFAVTFLAAELRKRPE